MEVKEVDTRDLILQKLRENERSVSWLAKKTGIPYGTLYDCVVRKGFSMNDANVAKINEALETNFQFMKHRRNKLT